MTNEWYDAVLEKVARECVRVPHLQTPARYYQDMKDMLQRELGPLLEAGQALREVWYERIEGPPAQWDAAKARLMKGKS